jgi:predicted tellurium resistance membrane protein TerC
MESSPLSEIVVGFLTLTALEIVLGIDNIIFISILSGKLPQGQQRRARRTGLGLAVISRLALLVSLSWIAGLTQPVVEVLGFSVTGRDLVLVGGGLFLLAKSTREIHDRLEGVEGHASARVMPSFTSVILQIMLLDVVFSLDSVITAVGMVREVWVMAAAVIAAVAIMLWAADPISDFVNRHPTVKILALSFLLLIGATLIIEGLHQHIPRGYIYFAMGFSVFVEMLNLRLRKPAAEPIRLREAYIEDPGIGAPARTRPGVG